MDFAGSGDSGDGEPEGRLIVLAGKPGAGATELGLRLMSHVAVLENRAVGLISLEMDSAAVVQRLINVEAGLDSSIPRDASMPASDFKAWSESAGRIHDAPIFIDDQAPRTTGQLPAEIRRMVSDHSMRILVLDYLGLVEPSDSTTDRSFQYAELCSHLKAIAEDIGVTIILVAKLDRTPQDQRPTLDQLEWSGSLTAVADAIFFLDPDSEESERNLELIFAKQYYRLGFRWH